MSAFENEDFEIVDSRKLGGGWAQGLVVIRHNVAYLRLAGDGTNYRVMTATAGEDVSGVSSCHNQERLLEAAAQLARKHEWVVDIEVDGKGRKYGKLFTISQEEDESNAAFTEDICELVREFFEIYDGLRNEAIQMASDYCTSHNRF